MGRTTVQMSEELADELHARKSRGDSYEDVIWRLIDRADSANDEPAPETRERPREREPDDDPHGQEERNERPASAASAGLTDEHRAHLRDELAGSGDVLDARVTAILAMYEYLQDHGEATKDELLGAVDVDATGYESAESVWANMVKGTDSLRALPGVETPPAGKSTWRFTADRGGDT